MITRMSPALIFRPLQPLRSLAFLLIASAFLPVLATRSGAEEIPWLVHPWKYNFDIPAGNYAGTQVPINVARTVQIGWLPGSQITDLELRMETAAGMQATACQFRLLSLGLSLKGKLDIRDSLLDECALKKINVWSDKKDPATRWRLSNCIIAKTFMGDAITVVDCGVRAVNCTFLDVKMPTVQYRNADVVNQAQQDWFKFEKCRFENCEVNDRLLAATIGCVFENCRYSGPDSKFAGEVSKPLEVKAYWTGSPAPAPVSDGNFTLSFPPPDSSIKAGTLMEYSNKNDRLRLASFTPSATPVAVLGATIPKSILSDTDKPPAPDTPTTPGTPAVPAVKPAVASTPSDPSVITGSAGAAEIPLKKTRSVINALLVIELPGQGVAGAAAKLSAMALPIDPQASTEVKFNVPVGPMMQTALAEVVKCLQLRNKGWPRGHRIELAFEDKFVPKDGPSAAVACALLLESMIGNWDIDPTIAVTGDLNADGSVQPIGGVSGKIRGATKAGCLRVAVPIKNARAVGDVLLAEGPETLARIEIFSIATLDSAIALARSPSSETSAAKPATTAPATGPSQSQGPGAATVTGTAAPRQLFQDVRRSLFPGNKWNLAGLRDRSVMAKLQEVFRLQPNDLSAGYLLAVANNTAPAKLTLRGSIETMDQVAEALVIAIKNKELSSVPKIGKDTLGDCVFKLRRSRARMDTRVLPAVDSLTRFGEVLRAIQNQPPRSQGKAQDMIDEVRTTAAEAVRQRDLLLKSPEVVEELMK